MAGAGASRVPRGCSTPLGPYIYYEGFPSAGSLGSPAVIE